LRGVRRRGVEDAVTLEDRWHIGSNTKAMTAALYARLVEAGQARWGATMGDLFPGMTIDPAWADITVEDLMSHRSGIKDGDVIGMSWLMTARGDTAPLTEQRTVIAARALGKAPTGMPGEFVYSNAGYTLLGAAIERITGLSWEDAARREIFEPLGMASAGFGAPQTNIDGGPNAWGHRALGPLKTAVDPSTSASDNPQAMAPAGTVHMTMADYARFVQVFLKDGDGWLTPESIAILTTPPEGADYAMGWGVSQRRAAWGRGPVLAHEGSNTMWHMVAVVAPGRGTAIITVSNEGPDHSGASALAGALMDDMGA
jgi:D-alanyl-D-alanine carboxypeptidase